MHRSWVAKAAGAACLLALAVAPGASASSPGKTTICHATGSAKNPYVQITVSNKALKAHRRHHDGRDIIPAPAGGCPKQAASTTDKGKGGDKPAKDKSHGKVTICHATGSAKNPYVKITISQSAVAAHKRHQGGRDIIPAPAGGCPGPAASSDKSKGKGGDKPAKDKSHGKVTICHATGSATNPYVQITISQSAVAAHKRHQGGRDIIPAPAGGCPGPAASGGEQPAASNPSNPDQSTNGADNGKGTDNPNANPNGQKSTASGTAPSTASGTAPSTASGTAPSTASGTAPSTAAAPSSGVKDTTASHKPKKTKRSKRTARRAVKSARAQAFTG